MTPILRYRKPPFKPGGVTGVSRVVDETPPARDHVLSDLTMEVRPVSTPDTAKEC